MKVATAEQMRAIDRRAIEDMGVPGAVLMEAAGIALKRACQELLNGEVSGKPIACFCGLGNNGGDGFVVARHLAGIGAKIVVFLAGSPEDIRGDAQVHFRPLRSCGVRVVEVASPEFERAIKEPFRLLVDALLGTGGRGPLNGPLGLLITHLVELAERGIPVVAADLPSGVDADTGAPVDFVAVPATRTVTFALPKPGLLHYPGAWYAGQITVADIGLPRSLLTDNPSLQFELTVRESVRALLPERKQTRDSNKGTYGSVLVIAGSQGMIGAATLTASSALRAGAGLVQLAVPESLVPVAAQLVPEVIVRGLPETPERSHGGPDAVDIALALAERADAVAIGPGMGGNPAVASFVQLFVRRVGKPLVVDADALNALKTSLTAVRYRGTTPTVLTPHPGELGRLLGTSADRIQSDRQEAVLRTAASFKAVTLLKGARTLIAAPDGRMAFNRKGSAALATAGSGDVLTGVIGALLGQALSAFDAARAGAYLHALAGEIAAETLGTTGVIATDVRDRVPLARKKLYEKDCVDEL
ncbi:MAG: NAD(P)H-hydrate dehydratase [Capsulimonadales bacterium]|nr:NAD(P)H-hydrate dehydratase [Capsulimonadales bacterium]